MHGMVKAARSLLPALGRHIGDGGSTTISHPSWIPSYISGMPPPPSFNMAAHDNVGFLFY